MNPTVLAFLFLTFACCISVQAYVPYDNNPDCYGNSCPTGTTRCKKHMKSNMNGDVSIEVECLDDADGVLKSYHFLDRGKVNPNSRYESTSFKDIGGGIPKSNQLYMGNMNTRPNFNRYEGYMDNNELDDLMS